MRNGIAQLVVFLLPLLFLSACGYGLSGRGLLVPDDARTIAIPAFLNNTNEPYVDSEVTRATVNEFMIDGRLTVVDRESADLALIGKVVKYDVTALSYTTESYVQQYSVRLVVDANLTDRRSGKVLWEERGIAAIFIADYPVAFNKTEAPVGSGTFVTVGDIKTTKVAKEAAIKKASQDIAWTLRSRVLEGF